MGVEGVDACRRGSPLFNKPPLLGGHDTSPYLEKMESTVQLDYQRVFFFFFSKPTVIAGVEISRQGRVELEEERHKQAYVRVMMSLIKTRSRGGG